MRTFFRSFFLFFLVIIVNQIGLGQQKHPLGTDAAEKTSGNRSAVVNAASGPRSSPFNPEDQNDHLFVTDSAPKLDTGCIFRSSGPIIFNIEITRHVGALNPDGTLKDAAALVAAKLISPTVTLTMPAFDVDFNAQIQGVQPERDRVSFNGIDMGFLTGDNNIWKQNRFQIPIGKVKFAERGAIGSSPSPARNEVRIDIDTANNQEEWCTQIDWGSLSFGAMSPIVLIHGNNSNGGFFDRQGFTNELNAQHLLYDNSIELPTSTIANNAKLLNDQIPPIVKSFGVDSIHLVVHSKGGLDSRSYLASYQLGRNNQPFKVLSYTSLSTPHNGSVGADVLVQREEAARNATFVEFSGFPAFANEIAKILGADAGTYNLTTTFVAGFNSDNVSRLPSDIVYNTVAADADQNGNQQIDRNNPDEFAELRQENSMLKGVDDKSTTVSRLLIDSAYQILRNTSSVTITYTTLATAPFGLGSIKKATLTSVPNASPVGNDVLVTIPSGLGNGTLAPRTTNTQTFTGAQGRNHSSVANAGVARTVIPWIISVERLRGDLK